MKKIYTSPEAEVIKVAAEAATGLSSTDGTKEGTKVNFDWLLG